MSTQTDAVQEDGVPFRLLHVGVNCSTSEEADQLTSLYCSMLGMKPSENPASYFVGSSIEVMKSPYLGTHGHMAYGVPNMEKALDFLSQRGFLPDMGTAVYNEEGKLSVVYLKGEFGGFAIHLKLI